ncbi:two-component sensor histidine kinase [Frigoribacterium sp. ACAM 257]|uniref:sensor histidine kinase n=1 Tax=Frigoribacterium sp. ACAM 257 TaxID=2508998 RepID=UPI0011B9E607|nr:histidine kinase [Frigoribacterium sp. ACAM 257]TWX34576.1 two-component sensor histidine kinase [Frigoribacterium sp. ACAM 257]
MTTSSVSRSAAADGAGVDGAGVDGAALHEATVPGAAATWRLLGRVGVRTPAGRDVVLAGVWTVVTVALLTGLLAAGELLGASGSIPPAQVAAVLVLAVAQCLPLALRRRWPAATLVTISVVQAGLLAVLPTGLAIWTAAPVVAAYTVGSLLPTRRTVGVVLVAVGVETVGAVVGATAVVKQALGAGAGLGGLGGVGASGSSVLVEALALVATAVLVNGISASVGSWVALRRRHESDSRARAAESVEHHETLTRSAVAAERTRMARELHDIAAHHLTGLVVQAGAAERLVDVDPERAKESLRSVRSQGRETLDSLRSIVGILRETGDDATGTAPVPGLRDVGGLVVAARAAGTVVDERVEGELPSLAPLADVTAYRTVQEALANARRHAPDAGVLLTTTVRPGRLVLVVENEVPRARVSSAPAGYGLVGMRERAALVGGVLQAGLVEGDAAGSGTDTRTGAWRVRLELPVETEKGSADGAADATADRADGGAS